MRSLVIIAGLLLSAASFAGTSTHGGKVLICTNQEVDAEGRPLKPDAGPVVQKSIQLADFWEWTELSGLKLDMGPANLNVDQKLQYVLDRLDKVDSFRAGRLAYRLAALKRRMNFVSKSQLKNIDDANFAIQHDKFCYLYQAAMQSDIIYSEEKKLLIDEQIYHSPLFSDNDRAGLLLHEAIYEERIEKFGDKTSDATRYLTFFLSSERAALFQSGEILQLVPFLNVLKDIKEQPRLSFEPNRQWTFTGFPFVTLRDGILNYRVFPYQNGVGFSLTDYFSEQNLSLSDCRTNTVQPALIRFSKPTTFRAGGAPATSTEVEGDCASVRMGVIAEGFMPGLTGLGCIGETQSYVISGKPSLQNCHFSMTGHGVQINGNGFKFVDGPMATHRLMEAFDTLPGHHFLNDSAGLVLEMDGAMAVHLRRVTHVVDRVEILCRPDFEGDCQVTQVNNWNSELRYSYSIKNGQTVVFSPR